MPDAGVGLPFIAPTIPKAASRAESPARIVRAQAAAAAVDSAPLLLDAISRAEDGRTKVRTPPAPREHLVRYYGWYGNRARLLRKIFEVDPMLCLQSGVKMRPGRETVEVRTESAIRRTVLTGEFEDLREPRRGLEYAVMANELSGYQNPE